MKNIESEAHYSSPIRRYIDTKEFMSAIIELYPEGIPEDIKKDLSPEKIKIIEEMYKSKNYKIASASIKNREQREMLDKYLFFECKTEEDVQARDIIEGFSPLEMELSIRFIKGIGIGGFAIDVDKIFKKCPLILSVDKLAALYNYLKKNNSDVTDDMILEQLTIPRLQKYQINDRYLKDYSNGALNLPFIELLVKLAAYVEEDNKEKK